MKRAASLVLSGVLVVPLSGMSASATTPAAAPTAMSVQTDRFVFTALGPNRYLQIPRAGHPVGDAVEAINRTNSTLTLRLDAVAAVRSPSGIYGFGLSGQGFSTHVHLGATEVALSPHAQRIIPVTVDAPAGTGAEEYAAVTAQEDTGDAAGLTVAARLAILIRVAGAPVAADQQALRGHPRPAVSLPDVAVAGGIAALAISAGGWLLLLYRRRRRRDDAARPGPAATFDASRERVLVEV